MRTRRLLTAALLPLALVAAGCGDDDGDVTTGDAGDEAVELPDAPPDIVGEVTDVEPFVPVTEDCVPADELDPDASVSSDDPPVCTPEDNELVGRVLVEEQPGVQEGRKISFTVTTRSTVTGTDADGESVAGFGGLAEGQSVEAWVEGDICAESYPEQCGAEAIRVTGGR